MEPVKPVEREKPKRLLILSGAPSYVEAEMNRLLDEYATILWNFTAVGDELKVTAILVQQRELRMAQLMAGGGGPGRPQ